MRKTNGVLLAATFSYGCRQAKRLGITPILEEYVKKKGKIHQEKEIREALSKLISYFFYCVISLATDIKDPFDIRVVKAYWIGNDLLEKVKLTHIKQVFKEFEKEGWDSVLLALALKSALKKDRYLHHNVYARHNPTCSVSTKDGHLWHLGTARIRASLKDIENLKKYGEE